MAKRNAPDTPLLERSNSGSSKKPRFSDIPSMACATSADLDVNVLRFQNKKLGDRLIARQKLEADLRQRIEVAEKKQTSAEAIVYVINRYWNQLNEDVRILLQRFDAETSDETEISLESDVTSSFLAQLSNWDSEEMSEQLQQRVEASTRAIIKVVQAFDRIAQRNAKVTAALTQIDCLDEAVKQANSELTIENKNLTLTTTELHEKLRILNLQLSEYKDKSESLEASNDELKNRMDELEFELTRMRNREMRLEQNLQEAKDKIWSLETNSSAGNSSSGGNSSSTSASSNMSSQRHEEMIKELEETKELAANRLTELEQLHATHKETLKTVDKLKMDLQCIPLEVVKETAEYKCLQSHFSVLYNECMQLKTQLEENRSQLQSSKNNHLRQIEHMESEELSMQKRLRNEVIQLEDSLAQVRREHEMLRLEFEQVMAANEQTGPINREMRNLITSLQNHNGSLKAEIVRLKKKLKEGVNSSSTSETTCKSTSDAASVASGATSDDGLRKQESEAAENTDAKLSSDLQKQLKELRSKHESLKSMYEVSQRQLKELKKTCKAPASSQEKSASVSVSLSANNTSHPSTPAAGAFESSYSQVTSVGLIESPAPGASASSSGSSGQPLLLSNPSALGAAAAATATATAAGTTAAPAPASGANNSSGAGSGNPASSQVARESSSSSSSNAQRQNEINRMREKIRQLEKTIQTLKESYSQQEEALCSEMESTGSAFENMQEMNIRLVQQLREKDEANFKLMAEKIKSSQIQKLLKEEKESLTEQVIALNAQVEAQNQVVRKLEEKERLLQNNLTTIEKETQVKQQALESHKRKALESAQTSADLKLHLDKYLTQLKEAQSTVAEKTSALQEQAYKTTRLQEDLNSFKRKYERAKKFELATTADEVLQEEIREYKDQLTCPSCKARRKDAVLTRCFHVFCYECLKTRYESRQRKCPKCTQNFGASDFHKLYLA